VVCDSDTSCYVAGTFSTIRNVVTPLSPSKNFVRYVLNSGSGEWEADLSSFTWNNATETAFVLPADTATLNWESGPNGSVTVAPQPTYTFSGGSQLISFPLPADSGTLCPLGVQEVAPAVSFQDPTCKKLNGAAWKGELTDIIDYTVTGTPGLGADVTVDAAIKPDLADEYEFVDGAVTSFSHGYPTLAELDCIKGEETIVPKPSKEPKPDNEPTVLGTQAAVPTAVAAGLGGTSSDVGTTTRLIAQLLVAGGMLLLMAGGWIGLGRRESGAHQA